MQRRFFIKSLAGLAMARAALAAGAESPPGWGLGPFVKADKYNPVLGPGEGSFVCPVRGERVKFEEKDVFNPAALVRGGKVCLLYRAEDKIGRYKGTSRIGLAVSDDGLSFERRAEPVLYPDNDEYKIYEWEGGCEDPRVVEDENGTCYLTYSAYDGRLSRLMVASSDDLVHWKKLGPAFAGYKNGKYNRVWSKSGSILCRREGERIVATRIKGKYWMYWGDADIYLAHSENLIDWIPIESKGLQRLRPASARGIDKSGLLPVMKPRLGRFDSRLVESGPPALVTERGILFLYNGANSATFGDRGLKNWTYSAGQALFDGEDPARLVARMDKPFLEPDKDYEIEGQVNNVCFVEGLVNFKGRWILYYGTADSKIAAAIC